MSEIWLQNPYIDKTRAKIVSCERTNGKFRVLLDKTVFRYKGGGQDCDKGKLLKNNTIYRIIDVEREEDKTVHIVKGKGPLNVGDEVICVLDWDRRYTLMKLHTAEHIFYRSLIKEFPGSELKDIWLTFDDEKREGNGTITVESDRPIDWKTLTKVEAEVNKIIHENRSVKTYILNVKDLTEDIRVRDSLLKRVDQVRIVEVENFDKAACSGTHLRKTSEITFFKITSIERKGNDNVYHINFKIGEDALNFALMVSNQVLWKAQNLGYNPDEIIYVLEKYEKLRGSLSYLKTQLLEALPSYIEKSREVVQNIPIYHGICKGFEAKELAMLGRKLKKKIKESFVAVLLGTNETTSIVAVSKGVNLAVSNVLKEFLSKHGGKGGGRPDFAIYGIKKSNNINELLNSLVNKFKSELTKLQT